MKRLREIETFKQQIVHSNVFILHELDCKELSVLMVAESMRQAYFLHELIPCVLAYTETWLERTHGICSWRKKPFLCIETFHFTCPFICVLPKRILLHSGLSSGDPVKRYSTSVQTLLSLSFNTNKLVLSVYFQNIWRIHH